MSIVNGAQTASVIADAVTKGLSLEKVMVPFRIISLAGSDPSFGESVTRANKTQNELSALDFVSLDERQELLANEISGLGYKYILKRGEEADTEQKSILVKEAAVALACACEQLSIAVQAKRYVSGLWSNTNGKPYTDVFPPNISGKKVVESVLMMREIDEKIRFWRASFQKEQRQILTHGDKFIAHCVLSALRDHGSGNQARSVDALIDFVCFEVISYYEQLFPGKHPPTVFKNIELQEKMKNEIFVFWTRYDKRSIPSSKLDVDFDL